MFCKTTKRFTDLTVDKVRELNEVFEVDVERFNVLSEMDLVIEVNPSENEKPVEPVEPVVKK